MGPRRPQGQQQRTGGAAHRARGCCPGGLLGDGIARLDQANTAAAAAAVDVDPPGGQQREQPRPGDWVGAGARCPAPGAGGSPASARGERQRGLVTLSLRRPGEVRPPTVFRAYRASAGVAGSPRRGRPPCGNVATGRQAQPATPVSGSPVGGSNRGRGCVHRRAPARGRRGPVVGGHASQSQVKGGCRHGQAWVMDRGRCGPDPGERVSVEGGALEPGSGRCTVAPGAQMDKDEHNRSGTRTLRLRSRVTCGQVHRVWITRSSGSRSHLVTAAPAAPARLPPRSGPPLGPLTAARAQSPHRARRYMHRRGPVLGHCRPGPPRVTPASAHCPPRGSPHVSQRDTRDVDAGVEVGEGGVGVQIRPRAAGDARPAGSSATPYPGAVSPIPTAGARSMVSASRP